MQVFEYPDKMKLKQYERLAYISYIESIPTYHVHECGIHSSHKEEKCTMAERCNKERSAITKTVFDAYLYYLQLRRYRQVSLWAMPPPNKDVNYIFHMRPVNTRLLNIPLVDRSKALEQWYMARLTKGKADGVISHFTDNTNATASNTAGVLFDLDRRSHSGGSSSGTSSAETDEQVAQRLAREGSTSTARAQRRTRKPVQRLSPSGKDGKSYGSVVPNGDDSEADGASLTRMSTKNTPSLRQLQVTCYRLQTCTRHRTVTPSLTVRFACCCRFFRGTRPRGVLTHTLLRLSAAPLPWIY